MFTPIIKHIDVPVCFLQEKIDNSLFVPKNDKYSIMQADMHSKTCPGTVISWITKWMSGFRFYASSDTEHHQLIKLHEFDVT